MAYITFQPNDYFNTKLYTGSGSAQSLTGVGFQPDWIWIKNRSYADHHKAVDRVRWVSSSNSAQLSPNQTSAAGTQGIITSFDSDGFTLTTGDRGWNSSNGDNFVSWNWKANGAGSSNSDGSVTSTVSANTTSGFSIVKFDPTGAACTIGHGLGVAPKGIIAKALNRTFSWVWGGDAIGWTKYLELNESQAEATSTARWNDTAPTSTVFSVKNEYNSGDNAIAYCFAEKTGYSKFGSYTGNGNADGTFVYTGFKPSWVMIKRYDSGTLDWNMYDNKRLGYNGGDAPLFANLSNAESNDYGRIDLVSNGFKIRTSNDQLANNGGSFLYMAFAEAPLVTSGNIPATAG